MKLVLAVLSLASISLTATASPCDHDLQTVASALTKGTVAPAQFQVGELVEGQYTVWADKTSYIIFTDESCNILTTCKAKADNSEVCWDAK